MSAELCVSCREIREIAEIRGGRLSDAERALERDEDVEGRASGDDRLGDDSWRTRHSQPDASLV